MARCNTEYVIFTLKINKQRNEDLRFIRSWDTQPSRYKTSERRYNDVILTLWRRFNAMFRLGSNKYYRLPGFIRLSSFWFNSSTVFWRSPNVDVIPAIRLALASWFGLFVTRSPIMSIFLFKLLMMSSKRNNSAPRNPLAICTGRLPANI